MQHSPYFLVVFLASGIAGAIDPSSDESEFAEAPAAKSWDETSDTDDAAGRPDALWTPALAIGATLDAFDALGPARNEDGVEVRVAEVPRHFFGIETEENVLSFVRGRLVSISARVADADAERLRQSLAKRYGQPRTTADGLDSWVSDGLLVEVASASESGALLRVERPSFAAQRIRASTGRSEVGRIPARRRAPPPRRPSGTVSPALAPRSVPTTTQAQWTEDRRLELIYSGTVKQSYSGALVVSGTLGLLGVAIGTVITASSDMGPNFGVVAGASLLPLTLLLSGIGLHHSAHGDFVRAGMPAPEKEPVEHVW